MSKNSKAVDLEILRATEYLNQLTPGSEEYTAAVESVAKLYKLRIEETKSNQEFKDKQVSRKIEEKQREAENEARNMQEFSNNTYRDADLNLRQKQLDAERRSGYIRFGLTLLEIGAPLVFYGIWMAKGFKFEETGNYTSTTFKNMFGKFKPTKK